MMPVPPLTPIKPDTTSRTDYWIKVVIGLCILIIAIDLSFLLINKYQSSQKQPIAQTKQGAIISGTFDINGYIPDGAIIEIQSRQLGETEFTTVAGPFSAVDTNMWSWESARNDATYELKAVVISNNTPVASSSILAVSAPALDEKLHIVSSLIPPKNATTPTNASFISGSIDLNGYIPWGATIVIQAKKQGETQFTTVVPGFKAVDGAAWSWDGAQTGTSYEIQATLSSGGTVIGTSASITTHAPAKNEVLTLNSKAIGPTTKESISGSFNINGTTPNGATITLAVRKSGTPQFATIKTGLAPVDGSSWNYADAQTGVSYDILAYLVVNNATVAQSPLLVVTAPAHNEKLTLNITARPSAPPQTSITFNCPGKNNNNQWQVAIQYNQNNVNPNAKAFILQLGSNSGSSDLFSIQTSPNNPSQMQSYTSNFMLNEGQTYFAQYAYSTCQNCTDPAFYSQFSQPIPIRCVTQPTNTPTPTVTNTPSPTISPIPTNTQTPTPTLSPTPTPKISQCNETCGGSGYLCANGLDCTAVGGGLGASVCRNPSCPDQTDCTCQ